MNRCAGVVWLVVWASAAVATEVPVISCPAVPPAVRTLDLVERWRLCGDDEGAPLVGVVGHVCAREPGGDLYFLDNQLRQILVFGPDGEYRATLGREGDGPGEFRQPNGLFALADGTLAVRDGWPTKLVLVDATGAPAGAWAPREPASLGLVRQVADGWLASGQVADESRAEPPRMHFEMFLARFGADGERGQVYGTAASSYVYQPPTHDERQPYFPYATWDLTADGLIVTSAARDAYRLEFRDLAGALVRVVEREFTPYRRTAADKDEIRDRYRMYANGVRQEIVFHLLDTEPAIGRLEGRPDGSLWVTTCYGTRELPDGVVQRFDVHAPDGTLREEVRIAGDCDLDFDALRLLPDGRAVILRNYVSASRAAQNTGDDTDPVRDDPTFAVIVCDLVPRR